MPHAATVPEAAIAIRYFIRCPRPCSGQKSTSNNKHSFPQSRVFSTKRHGDPVVWQRHRPIPCHHSTPAGCVQTYVAYGVLSGLVRSSIVARPVSAVSRSGTACSEPRKPQEGSNNDKHRTSRHRKPNIVPADQIIEFLASVIADSPKRSTETKSVPSPHSRFTP